MLESYDAPQSLPCVAPRPLLIANGELDARCHMPGVLPAMEAARKVGCVTAADRHPSNPWKLALDAGDCRSDSVVQTGLSTLYMSRCMPQMHLKCIETTVVAFAIDSGKQCRHGADADHRLQHLRTVRRAR